jgi:hypothetical protein
MVGSPFVPKGLNDGSLARSAWKRGEAVPPRRVRSDLLPVFRRGRGVDVLLVCVVETQKRRDQITPFPTGRVSHGDFPGISCQAIIM